MEGDDDGVIDLVDMEDNIDDVEEYEEDEDEEIAVGEEDHEIPSSVMDFPHTYGRKRPSGPTFGLSKRGIIAERKSKWLSEPDVLGYLNSFRFLTDGDRLRLARACANYLNHQERQRTGYFQRRASTKASGDRQPKASLKRTRSVRDLSKMLDVEAVEEGGNE